MALGEVRLRDWWRVMRRELMTGLALGTILGVIGLIRIWLFPSTGESYSAFAYEFSLTVAVSLVAVVLWGALVGSMLPIALKKAKLDPASASAPLVATLCDVTGLMIYFNAANYFLARALTE
jgi:magnesium transporter